ncbi:MAG TPA: hypothetical protein VEC57_13085 [Candidatus Limnocylindrales bacterium]|nr:hypothetical protein [Candidatus Limnocylindrales bacterium]
MSRRQSELARIRERLALRQSALQSALQREAWFGRAGVLVLMVGLAALFARSDQLFEPAAWRTVILTLGALVPLVLVRRLWSRRRVRLSYSVDWLQQALRRLDDDFAFGQADGSEYLDPEHPYAGDLDIFGDGSLFQRLNACRTALGRDALASWLAGSFGRSTLAERREAIEELAAGLDLRENMELELRVLEYRGAGDERDRESLERSTRSLVEWMRSPTPASDTPLRIGFEIVAGLLASVAFVVWATTDAGLSVLAPFYLFNGWLLLRARDVEELVVRFERVRDTLEAWSRVLVLLEGMQVRSALLRRLQAAVHGDGEAGRASQALVRLKRLADLLSQRRNVVWLLSFDVLWLADLHVRRRLLAWKRHHGADMASWMEAAAMLEALCALASYRAAIPESVHAGIAGCGGRAVVASSGAGDGTGNGDGAAGHGDDDASGAAAAVVAGGAGAILAFEDLAHPLLPASTRVGNSLSLSPLGTICVVTGSNMSGKSTFLRTAGVAVVMTQAGLPVPARAMTMRENLAVVTCMNVHDSLKDASSLFHAEVRRLRQCLDRVAAGTATLVLFDEILAGTNSRERHIGAIAILESLRKLPAVSLVSTHDLGLAELAGEHPDEVSVVHFRDHVRDGRMTFDYTLRPGPLPSTNALRVMRLAGLDVPAC